MQNRGAVCTPGALDSPFMPVTPSGRGYLMAWMDERRRTQQQRQLEDELAVQRRRAEAANQETLHVIGMALAGSVAADPAAAASPYDQPYGNKNRAFAQGAGPRVGPATALFR